MRWTGTNELVHDKHVLRKPFAQGAVRSEHYKGLRTSRSRWTMRVRNTLVAY